MSENPHRYDDIITLEHRQSETRPHMSMHGRAAQFAPFAALVGYDSAINETARATSERAELSEDQKSAIDMKLSVIAAHIAAEPEVNVTYFVPDGRKEGGAYVTLTGNIRRIDEAERRLVFSDKRTVAISDICDLTSELTEGM